MSGVDGDVLRYSVHALSVPPTVPYELHANHRQVLVVDNTFKNGSTTKEDAEALGMQIQGRPIENAMMTNVKEFTFHQCHQLC